MKRLIIYFAIFLPTILSTGCETTVDGEDDGLKWYFDSNTESTNNVVKLQGTAEVGNSTVTVTN